MFVPRSCHWLPFPPPSSRFLHCWKWHHFWVFWNLLQFYFRQFDRVPQSLNWLLISTILHMLSAAVLRRDQLWPLSLFFFNWSFPDWTICNRSLMKSLEFRETLLFLKVFINLHWHNGGESLHFLYRTFFHKICSYRFLPPDGLM